ncbi:MAG: FAD-binding protein [Planctomycetaceae bacterium]
MMTETTERVTTAGDAAPSNVEADVRSIDTDRLSHFRTQHDFLHYGEARSVEQFIAYRRWADARDLPLLILGNGSNVLFTRKRVRALVVKNKLPRTLEELNDNTIRVSSTVAISQVIKWCKDRHLDSCYYLASVPATIGGAIAMNAGRGRRHNKSIFDFVENVTFLDGDGLKTLSRSEMPVGYRRTPFTGLTSKLIISAELAFPPRVEDADAGHERVRWSRENQDHSAPNCGSVFRESHWRIMSFLRGRAFGTGQFSPKTANWLLSHGASSRPLVRLIRIAQVLHRLVGKRAVVELIQVD